MLFRIILTKIMKDNFKLKMKCKIIILNTYIYNTSYYCDRKHRIYSLLGKFYDNR